MYVCKCVCNSVSNKFWFAIEPQSLQAKKYYIVVVEAHECQRHTVAYEKFRMGSGGSDEKHMNIMNIDKVQMMHILDQY